MIYSDFSTHPREIRQSQLAEESVFERLRALREALSVGGNIAPKDFKEVVRSTRLFESYVDLVEQFIREEFE